jgi:manganese/zinc/iron transport system ATP- binding protein
MKSVIEVKDLSVSYGASPALWDISLKFPKGELIGVMGPNGAGKSTLLKAILGHIPKISGEVTFLEKASYVPQAQSVDWNFPILALEVVMMGAYLEMNLLKWPTKAIKERALQIMQDLGMKEFASCHISELSGGQKQKLFIGRALMQKATLYLLDEPFVGIDHTTQEQLITLFKKMRDEGKTLVIVHHDLNSAQEIFDSIVLLNTYLVAAGPTKSVFNMENLKKAYGQSETLLEQLLKVSKGKKGL